MEVKPRVSIIMATYNRANFIVETLVAIQNQTFTDWECLIIDDGGTDNTKEVIAPILEKDNRFKFYLRPSNYQKALPGCRNYGLDLAKGDFIIYFDDDDIPHPQNLEICVSELSNTKNIYYCKYERKIFSEDFHYNFDFSKTYTQFCINEIDVAKILTYELAFNSCQIMWKRECFKKNRFIEHLMYMEEYELYARIVSSGFNGIAISKVLFFGRKHADSITREYYSDNPVRRKSSADAMVLAIENLREKKLLNYYITRYFIVISHNFEEYNLFNRILKALKLPFFKEIQWRIFFFSLKIRLPINRFRAKLKKKKIKEKNKF
jgi:glycosyltransferase involved in cell wall biosynthesis